MPLNLIALLGLLFFPVPLSAQGWDGFYLSGHGSESIDCLIVLPDGGALTLISYDAPWEMEGNVFLPHLGRRDLALVRWDKDKKVLWRQFALGPDLDENKGLLVGSDGALYWTGNCWDGLVGEDWVISGQPGLRSIFLIKLDLDGKVLRTQVWGGNNLKSVESLVQTDRGDLVLAGFFKSQFWTSSDTLRSVGNTDAFVIGCDTSLQQQWVYQAGGTKDCRALHLAALPDGQVAVSGYFDGVSILGNDTLTASSNDEDVWLAILEPTLGVTQAWRAGGVLNSRPEALTYVYNTRQLAVAGTFSGVMQVRGATPSIQSNGLATNGFVWMYHTTTQSHKLLNFGTTALEALKSAVGIGDTLFVAGYYEGTTRIGMLDLPGLPAQGQGFVMGLDSSGTLVQVLPIRVSERIVPSQLLQYNERLALVGAYRGKVEASPSVSSDGFDGLLLTPSTTVFSAQPLAFEEAVNLVQPCQEQCLVLKLPEHLLSWQIYDRSGILMKVLPPGNTIDLSQVPDGLYLLGWKSGKTHTHNGLKIISKVSY